MAIPVITVTPSAAAQAYRNVEAGSFGGAGVAGAGAAPGGADFGGMLQRAVEGVVDTSRNAETMATQAIAGGGNLTDVVTAVSKAELALQTTVALRDKVVQALSGHHEDADLIIGFRSIGSCRACARRFRLRRGDR